MRPVVVLPQPLSPTSPNVSPSFNLQADIVDGFDVADGAFEEAASDWEMLLEILDLQKQG